MLLLLLELMEGLSHFKLLLFERLDGHLFSSWKRRLWKTLAIKNTWAKICWFQCCWTSSHFSSGPQAQLAVHKHENTVLWCFSSLDLTHLACVVQNRDRGLKLEMNFQNYVQKQMFKYLNTNQVLIMQRSELWNYWAVHWLNFPMSEFCPDSLRRCLINY